MNEYRQRANELMAEMQANPELMEFLVGMAQEPQQQAPEAAVVGDKPKGKGRAANKNDVDSLLK